MRRVSFTGGVLVTVLVIATLRSCVAVFTVARPPLATGTRVSARPVHLTYGLSKHKESEVRLIYDACTSFISVSFNPWYTSSTCTELMGISEPHSFTKHWGHSWQFQNTGTSFKKSEVRYITCTLYYYKFSSYKWIHVHAYVNRPYSGLSIMNHFMYRCTCLWQPPLPGFLHGLMGVHLTAPSPS